jgi:hypothetical protein
MVVGISFISTEGELIMNTEYTPEKVNIWGQESNKWAFDLDYIKENSRSIYAEGMYGDTYRIEKKTNRVYINGIFWITAEKITLL